MTVEDIIAGFFDDNHPSRRVPEERLKFFREICQETVKTCMEINSVYHTPEELVELMSKMTGKKLTQVSECTRRFMQISAEILHSVKMFF